MNFDSLHTNLSVLMCVLAFIGSIVVLFGMRTIRRSAQRRVATLVLILIVTSATIVCAIDATLYGIEGRLLPAGIGLSIIPLLTLALILLILIARNDDDWFNDEFKRLKKKWRKLRSWRPRLPRVTSPRPAPSPN